MAKNNSGELLTNDFVTELFAVALQRRTVFDVVKQYIKYSYLQDESEKKIWQWCVKRYDLQGKIPTFGQLQQQFSEDDAVLEKLSQSSLNLNLAV